MINDLNILTKKIFNIQKHKDFEQICIEVFHYQYQHNLFYKKYVDLLKRDIYSIHSVENIPFLPIQFFKTHEIVAAQPPYDNCFLSSATTGMIQSKHYVKNIDIYKESYQKCFEQFYGKPSEYVILALLPSYLEREGSSLIFMVEDMIKQGKNGSGFYLYQHQELFEQLQQISSQKQKCILFGVSFALLDFAEKFKIDFPELIIMETGGMKGKREEMTKQEMHEILKQCFNVESIHSEYGMTELLSQGYSKGNGIFETPNWMNILIRDTNDPFSYVDFNKTGGINVIDLANINSCSFIATQDLGKKYENNTFEILGRFDNSDIRGCNLLVV